MLAVCCMSHSPLLGHAELSPEIDEEILAAFNKAREFVREFDPEVVVVFSPDHYNGFFYQLMPAFALGTSAVAVGDFDSSAGPLNVPTELAQELAEHVLAAGVDLALSVRMEVDHGAVQPLEVLWGEIDVPQVIPIFINSVAPPFGPMSRVRALGEAVGSWAAASGKRVLLLASGGLSHDPPAPQLATAAPEVRERLVVGGARPRDGEVARLRYLTEIAKDLTAGDNDLMMPLNAQWDNLFLDHLAAGTLAEIDSWSPDSITALGGHSAHEVRTWLAAFAALSVAGDYSMSTRYYRPIPELIAGFAVATARPNG